MSLQLIPLRKLLKLIFSEPAQRRTDVRSDIRRASGNSEPSSNFQTVFWADAKRHVLESQTYTIQLRRGSRAVRATHAITNSSETASCSGSMSDGAGPTGLSDRGRRVAGVLLFRG